MKKEFIACCGLDCETCDARVATVRDDDGLRERTARKWSELNNAPQITPETINCTGCRSDGVKFGYCGMCGIRRCVHEKGLDTCGDCAEVDSCPTVGAIFRNVPGARENLLK